jgi:N-acetylglucosamine-6-phosphate deacetylase
VENGRIAAVRDASRDPGDLWAAPGLIDLQVNGFAGVDYNDPDVTLEAIARSVESVRATGVTRFLPTVITGSRERMSGALRKLARAKQRHPEIAGFHVEGPFISAEEGPRGAHPKEHVRPPDRDEFDRLQEAADGGIRLLTLAPETPGALELIEYAASRGVVVSIGHTGASGAQIRDAIRAGATMSTHLGNGAHSLLPRHPNYIWEQMAADELYAGLIVDGIHLPPSFVKCAVRAKGLEKSILVTDATAPANCPPGRYRLGGMDVDLTAEGKVTLAGTERLAGSALRMDRGLENLMRFAGVGLGEALRMATVNPARAMGMQDREGFLRAGDAAELLLFRFDSDGPRIAVQ